MVERSEKGAHTLREIRSQADSWEAVFPEIDRKKDRLFDLVQPVGYIKSSTCQKISIQNTLAGLFQAFFYQLDQSFRGFIAK